LRIDQIVDAATVMPSLKVPKSRAVEGHRVSSVPMVDVGLFSGAFGRMSSVLAAQGRGQIRRRFGTR
jgi:hypothetical protein